jgi:hypothetical protein
MAAKRGGTRRAVDELDVDPMLALAERLGSTQESHRFNQRSFTEVPACELSPRTRLQIFLEEDCGLFFVKLHDYESSPGAIRRGMWRQTRIVRCEPGFNVRGQADVIRGRTTDALDDVDEALGVRHHTRL